MRVLLQRVSRASVRVDGMTVGSIERGLVVFLGVETGDNAEDADWNAVKTAQLRIFPDAEGRMNLAVEEVQGAVLVVSQFTLYGDAHKGRRPSFIAAAPPPIAVPLYEHFVMLLRNRGAVVETGEFGAMMDVELVNDGPVTIWLEREANASANPDG